MNILAINTLFTLVFLGGAYYFWLQTVRVKKIAETSTPAEEQRTLISISVPKNNDRTPLAAEQLFAALHGIFRSDSVSQPQVSCEVVSKNKLITFYIMMPTNLKDFVLSQVYAQYPNVDVKEVLPDEDYAKLDENKHLAATELTLKKPTTYPIKTFQNFEVDPISSLTGVLSSTALEEEIWVQLIVRPIDDDWQKQGEDEIKNIKEPPKKPTGLTELVRKEAANFAMEFVRSVATGSGTVEKKEEKKDDKKELAGPVQQAIKGIEEKITKLGFEATIRIVAAAPDSFAAQAKLEQVIGAYKQYNTLNLNAFISKAIATDREAITLYHSREIGTPAMIFNITELASLYHFPSETVATPTIAWAGAKKGEPPANLPVLGSVPADELTVFAQTNFRNDVRKFGIKRNDRRLHTYIIGKTGTGKSTLMENMIYDDIREGRGVAVVDPHGELIEHILDLIPEDRINDVVYFNPADYDFPIGFNVLESVANPELKNVIASGVVGIFKKIFGESWGPRLEYILRNAILALLEYPNATLLGVMRILTDNAYRRQVVNVVKDPVIRDFFVNEYEKYDPKFRQEAINPIQNKVGQFLSSSTIRNIVGQPKSTMDIRQIMDEGKILLANLSTGRIGEDNSALLGSMLITKIQLAAMGRTDIEETQRRDFYLYVDEFQNFATDSFATILSEARKYRLNLIMINQYISQMPETVANAVFGNVGTMISFRVGAGDAEKLKTEFQPVFDVNDLVNQPNRHIYLKMAIDGVTMPAFSAATLPPPQEKYDLKREVIEASRAVSAVPRADVEEYIAEWSAPINLSEDTPNKDKKMKFFSGTPQEYAQTNQAEQAKPQPSPAPLPEKVPEVIPQAENKSETGEREAKNLEHSKIEIVNDRFNRKWYAVSPREKGGQVGEPTATELPRQGNEDTNSTTTPEQSGGAEEKGSEEMPLITWEKASELGLKLPEISEPSSEQIDGLEPIDEL